MKLTSKLLLPAALCAALLVGCGAEAAVSDAADSASSAVSEAASGAEDIVSEAVSEAADTIDETALEAAKETIETVNPVANARAIDDFSLENEMNLTKDNIVAYVGDVTNDQADCALVFVAQVKDGTADAVVDELKAYQETMTGNLYAEFADKVAKAEDARIVSSGNTVVMVISGVDGPDYSEIDDVLDTLLG